jgi:predicted permease
MKQREGKVRSHVDISADMYPSLNWDKGSAGSGALLLCSLPAGFFGILFAVSYGVSARSTASIIVGSTLASAVTLSLAIASTLGPFGQ